MGKTRASTLRKDSGATRKNRYHPPKFISQPRSRVRTNNNHHRPIKPNQDLKIPCRSTEKSQSTISTKIVEQYKSPYKSPIDEWKDTLVKIAEFQVAISKDTHFSDRFSKGSPEQVTVSKKKDPKFRVFMGFNTSALDDKSKAKLHVHTYNNLGASIEVPYDLKLGNHTGFKHIPITAIVDDFEGWLNPTWLSTLTKTAPTTFKANIDAWLGAICKFYLDCHIKKFFPVLGKPARSIKKTSPLEKAVRLEKKLNPVGTVKQFPDFINKLVCVRSMGTQLRASPLEILEFVRNHSEYFQWSHLSAKEETGKMYTLYRDDEEGSRNSDTAKVIRGENLPNKRSDDDGKVSSEEGSTLISANAGNTSCPSLQSHHYDTCTAESGVTHEASDAATFMSPNGAGTKRPWQGHRREKLRTGYKKKRKQGGL